MTDNMVLCYHALSPSWDAALSVTPGAFERQIGFLKRQGWEATTFTAIALGQAGQRSFAVTFDDAFASVKAYALPILASLGVPATVFAPTSFLDGAPALEWPGISHWKESPHASELAPMSWDDLGELAEAGWEIGSHTATHPHLTTLDDDALDDELTASRARCVERLGGCESIAYPYGNVDDRVVDATCRAGYRSAAALSSSLRRLGPLQYPRVGIYHADDWRRFRLKTSRSIRVLRSSPLWALRRG